MGRAYTRPFLINRGGSRGSDGSDGNGDSEHSTLPVKPSSQAR